MLETIDTDSTLFSRERIIYQTNATFYIGSFRIKNIELILNPYKLKLHAVQDVTIYTIVKIPILNKKHDPLRIIYTYH